MYRKPTHTEALYNNSCFKVNTTTIALQIPVVLTVFHQPAADVAEVAFSHVNYTFKKDNLATTTKKQDIN